MQTQRIGSNLIEVGDTIVFLDTPHVITEVAPYDGPFDFIIGIARDAHGWGISLEDSGVYDVAKAPQPCRDCGKRFPYDEARDRCHDCAPDDDPVWVFCTCQDISRDVFDCALHGANLRKQSGAVA
jgi:hypothetical protein